MMISDQERNFDSSNLVRLTALSQVIIPDGPADWTSCDRWNGQWEHRIQMLFPCTESGPPSALRYLHMYIPT